MNAFIRPTGIGRKSVIPSASDREAMLDLIDERTDRIAASKALPASPNGRMTDIGHALEETRRLLEGANPIAVIRERRKMTRRALAAAAGISAGSMGLIESGKKQASAEVFRLFANILKVDIGLLIE